MENIDVLDIEPKKPFLVESGGKAYWCDLYFPKDDYYVIGNIIPNPDVPYENQQVISSIIKSGVVIHEFDAELTVGVFYRGVQFAQMLEAKKVEGEIAAYRQCDKEPEGGQYA